MNTDSTPLANACRSSVTGWPVTVNSESTTAAANRVLVADDDPEIRDVVARLLREAGFRVGIAADGEAAWAALVADHFDLLITDNSMPRLTGLGLLQRIRARPQNLPAIVISGNLSADDQAQFRELRPGAFLEKPFSFHVLLAQVRELLRVAPAATTAGAIKANPF